VSQRPLDEKKASQEHQLFEFTQRLAKFRAGRRAIHIHLSQLRAYNRRGHHIRIAVNTFEFLVKQMDGQIFALSNADLIFVCKGADIVAIDEAVMRLRHLFHDDPLTQDVDEHQESRFCSWYDLERQYAGFLAIVQALYDEDQKRNRRLAAISGPGQPGQAAELPPLSPHRLGELVDAISRADLPNMMRRQAVCTILPDAPPQPVFRELYISIDELRAIVMPGYNIASDRWLFQHLTQTLDLRMLQLLMKNDDRAIASGFSVNLNVATLLSDRFLAFDANLKSATRGTVIFELQAIDIFSDLGAFIFARDFVKERGYRVCLDGVTDLTMPFIDRERLGLDMIKIVWNPDMLGSGREAKRDEFRKQIASFGRARTILCRCDGEEAVSVGQSLGINLFQGRHIDRLLGVGAASVGELQKLRAAAATAPRRAAEG
jgi:EAL domain-containing protein (putative c-di-GMP-specific phosphodiesterase class I)